MNGVGQDIKGNRNLKFDVSREDTMKTVGVLVREKSSDLIDVEQGKWTVWTLWTLWTLWK